MVEASTARGRIFISYRREETAYPAGWLFDRLVDHFGEGQVFKDIDSIEPGDDFVDVLNSAVGSCDVLLALIGAEWLTVADENGSRRIDNPADFVRLEIEAALSRKVRVVPVLVDGAQMPRAEELPPSLAGLARRHALELSPSHFDFETSRLLRVLEETLGAGQPQPPTPESAPRPDESPAPARRTGRRAPLSRRAWILAGVGVVIAVAVLIPVLLLVLDSKPGTAAAGVIFRDDFSSRANGWDDTGGQRNGGHYLNGAYRLHTEWTKDHFSDEGLPRKAKSVFPSAPRDVKVQVVARRLLGGNEDTGYGIACRVAPSSPSYYQFAIWHDKVVIAKVTPTPPYYRTLKQSFDLSAVNRNGENVMQALCTTDQTGAASLVFSVNGAVVARAPDTDSPLSTGTVGLVVGTDGPPSSTIEAEFDDFVVTPA